MNPKLKRLSEQIIVITGASSGIGLTTARMAAEKGARVVMVARNETALKKAAEDIARRGGSGMYVVADVTDPGSVSRIAEAAIETFGGFDTWVNNAGVAVYGRNVDIPLGEKRRVFDVNFWGVVHGCRTALSTLAGRGGAIINVGSVASDVALPLLGIYSASKHAVTAYTDSLRMELQNEKLPVSVSLVKPSSINTPFVEHARVRMDREPDYAPPVYAPEAVARAILRCAEKPIREVTVGAGIILSVMSRIAPRATDIYQRRIELPQMRSDKAADSRDTFERPSAGVHYGSRGPSKRHLFEHSTYTTAVLSDAFRAVLLGTAGVLAYRFLRDRAS